MSTELGSGTLIFDVEEGWAKLPQGWNFKECADVAVNSKDRVYAFNRGAHPVIVFDEKGKVLDTWGEGIFERPHGMFVAPDDTLYCADDFGHALYHLSPAGEMLATMGTPGRPSDTGVSGFDYRTMKQAAGPFNGPTNAAVAPDGTLYVSDGYCNARIHKYAPGGELLYSWGEPGDGPGQFAVPHDVGIARDGTVFVCDRENTRLQLFSPEGEFLEQWTDVARPCNLMFDQDDNIYVAEVGFQMGMFNGKEFPDHDPVPARVSVFNRDGRLLARWGAGQYGKPGHFFAAHGIAVSGRGDVYVGEVRPNVYGTHANMNSPRPPDGTPVLQKFVRQG